jgi:DNA-directed RNA polymerase specialized sigma24 family protein
MIAEGNASSSSRTESAGFKSTHWTVVLEAARQDSVSGQAALGALYETYWAPIYAFVRRRGQSPDDAEDLTQDFFARLVEKNWLVSITREGGKFRSVLLTALKHFLSHARDFARAQKRGGGLPLLPLDGPRMERCYLAEAVDKVTPETLFERRWALGILEGTLERLRQEYERMEKGDLFDELKGFLSGGTRSVAHAEIAAKHGISVNAVGVAIHRMRRRFGELLRQQVARTVSDPTELEDELRHLIAILGQ